MDQYTKVRGRARRKSKSFKSESEEYDTLGSDSDTEVGTSSRTESSNHLDDSGPASIMARSPGPNSINQREQRLALVQRPVHHSKLVFTFMCPGLYRNQLPLTTSHVKTSPRTLSRCAVPHARIKYINRAVTNFWEEDLPEARKTKVRKLACEPFGECEARCQLSPWNVILRRGI